MAVTADELADSGASDRVAHEAREVRLLASLPDAIAAIGQCERAIIGSAVGAPTAQLYAFAARTQYAVCEPRNASGVCKLPAEVAGACAVAFEPSSAGACAVAFEPSTHIQPRCGCEYLESHPQEERTGYLGALSPHGLYGLHLGYCMPLRRRQAASSPAAGCFLSNCPHHIHTICS